MKLTMKTYSFVHVEKNSHLKTLRSTAFSNDPCSGQHLHCTHPSVDYVWCPLLSEGSAWDKRGSRACISLQPESCCWMMLLITRAANDSVRRRPVPQKPQKLSVCFPPWGPHAQTHCSCFIQDNRLHCYTTGLKLHPAESHRQRDGLRMGDDRFAT